MNDHAKATQSEVINLLKESVGNYKLFEEGAGEETAFTISERSMQMRVAAQFGNARQRLETAL